MDHFYSFLIFAALLALEWLAGQNWLGAYYRLGIPVNFTRQELVKGPDSGGGEAGELARALEGRFMNRPGCPALRFKALARDPQENEAIAFHETLFAAQGGPRYFPVMHSLARVDRAQGVVSVTGWLNGYVVFLLVYLVANTIADRGFLFVAVLVLILFGLSYAAQAAVNKEVAEEIRRL